MTKILMVCLGNICRSPLAEGILKSKLPPSFSVDSAGTSNYHVGSKPDMRAIAVAKKYGIAISNLKARQFTVLDFDQFDHIYVMDASNYQQVTRLARNNADTNKVEMILNSTHPNTNYDVPDPYYGDANGFETVYNLINDACNLLSKKLTTND